jgi:hypothetical protein
MHLVAAVGEGLLEPAHGPDPSWPRSGSSGRTSGWPGWAASPGCWPTGGLRPGLSASEARDLLWTLNSLAVHDLLVLRLGWPPERFRDWLAAALARELLPG